MTYSEAEAFLFGQFASFHHQGKAAFNKSLDKITLLLEAMGNPHTRFKSVHVAGTNGKGSSCHLLSSVLQETGYITGLYTSPHLKSFTERIRINGQPCTEAYITQWVEQYMSLFEALKPSFFEITTAMAFDYFAQQQVDIAIIETGLGGRLDATNVIVPEVSLITSISYDHQDILGNTLEEIAGEKAGIIKKGVPVVISDTQSALKPVFEEAAGKVAAPIYFAQLNESVALALRGACQQQNAAGVLQVVSLLQQQGWSIADKHIVDGMQNVIVNTGLKGRMQVLQQHPTILCDTAHNEDGIKQVVEYLATLSYEQLFVVFGMVKDKNIVPVLQLLPPTAQYIFTQANSPRALPATDLLALAQEQGLSGTHAPDVNSAIRRALNKATKNDLIYVGGSTFVVAEVDNL